MCALQSTPRGYRPDIDGLRAVAVLAVVLYHFDFSFFAGGFVGVDVFFVISGYLITGIILQDIARGQFSIARFYERRIRRIFPPLFVVMGCCLLAGAALFGPRQLVELADSVVAATLFFSNLLFWTRSDYFALDAHQQPLLHTWSLAIEEQFYIVFPLVLVWLARRRSHDLTRWLAVACAASLGLSVYTVFNVDASTAFYLVPFRAWELLVGALLALGVADQSLRRVPSSVCAAGGLVLIGASVVSFDAQTQFPGAAALLPTLGTALIIRAGTPGDNVVSRLLGTRPLVGVGLISYSLYLWHWPVYVFAAYLAIVELTGTETVLVLAVSVLLAVASWRYVERPFRSGSVFGTRSSAFRAATVAMASFVLAAATLTAVGGDFGRGVTTADNRTAVADAEWQRSRKCEVRFAGKRRSEPCVIGDQSTAPTFLLWGDSHASSLLSVVDRSATRAGLSGQIVAKTACPPLMGIERQTSNNCGDFNDAVLEHVRSHPGLRVVVLAARWTLSAEQVGYGQAERKRSLVTLVDLRGEAGRQRDMFELGLRRTVHALRGMGRSVVLVSQVPEVGYDVPSAATAASHTGRDINTLISPALADVTRRSAKVTATLAALAAQTDAVVIDPTDVLCDDTRCDVSRDGRSLYRDSHHLSGYGATLLAPSFDRVWKDLLTMPRRHPAAPAG